METLKLTTLTLLIPFGWLVSDSVAAYPQPLNATLSVSGQHSKPSCDQPGSQNASFADIRDELGSYPKALEFFVLPQVTTLLHHERETPPHACQLDLDLVDVDLADSAR